MMSTKKETLVKERDALLAQLRRENPKGALEPVHQPKSAFSSSNIPSNLKMSKCNEQDGVNELKDKLQEVQTQLAKAN
jgi:hypothetical protein